LAGGGGGLVIGGVLLLSRIGVALVFVGAVAGASVAMLTWCYTSLRQTRTDLAADRELLSGVQTRFRETEGDLQQRADRWKREAEQLDMRAGALEGALVRHEQALATIASRSSRVVHHRSATFVYEIGEVADEDRVSEEYATIAGEQNRPLLWCDVRVGLRGTGIPPLRSLRELNGVEATQVIDGKKHHLELLPAGQVGAMYRALVLFEPAIMAEARAWMWSYRWPLWNPLRRSNRDSLGLEVFKAYRYDLLEIRVVFPRTAIDPAMQPRESTNVYVPSAPVSDDEGRQTIVVKLVTPEPDHYSWTLTVGGFTDQRGRDR
jgi:hypothetical protein